MAQIEHGRVKIKCRKCNQMAFADEFKLDFDTKMVVCPKCLARRSNPIQTIANNSKSENVRSIDEVSNSNDVMSEIKKRNPELATTGHPKAGWDKDDEYLELAALKKQKEEAKFKPSVRGVDDSGNRKVRCMDCRYVFAYNVEKNYPRSCPYCGKIIKLK